MGLDSDDAARARRGRARGRRDRLARRRRGALRRHPARPVSTSMTINAPAPCWSRCTWSRPSSRACPRGVGARHRAERRAQGVRRARHLHLPAAARACAWRPTWSPGARREAPRFNAISLSGYHMREAGSTAVQEMAFALANAIAYVEAVLGARRRRRRLRPAALVDLQHAHQLLRGDRQVPRAAAHVGADHARALRRARPALDACCARTRRRAARR